MSKMLYVALLLMLPFGILSEDDKCTDCPISGTGLIEYAPGTGFGFFYLELHGPMDGSVLGAEMLNSAVAHYPRLQLPYEITSGPSGAYCPVGNKNITMASGKSTSPNYSVYLKSIDESETSDSCGTSAPAKMYVESFPVPNKIEGNLTFKFIYPQNISKNFDIPITVKEIPYKVNDASISFPNTRVFGNVNMTFQIKVQGKIPCDFRIEAYIDSKRNFYDKSVSSIIWEQGFTNTSSDTVITFDEKLEHNTQFNITRNSNCEGDLDVNSILKFTIVNALTPILVNHNHTLKLRIYQGKTFRMQYETYFTKTGKYVLPDLTAEFSYENGTKVMPGYEEYGPIDFEETNFTIYNAFLHAFFDLDDYKISFDFPKEIYWNKTFWKPDIYLTQLKAKDNFQRISENVGQGVISEKDGHAFGDMGTATSIGYVICLYRLYLPKGTSFTDINGKFNVLIQRNVDNTLIDTFEGNYTMGNTPKDDITLDPYGMVYDIKHPNGEEPTPEDPSSGEGEIPKDLRIVPLRILFLVKGVISNNTSGGGTKE
ncbi:MAG: hypothetical protein MJ252_02265 [archaeon]|nr:hypothetical protein [archaeon]